jgi:hypothetical protein
VVRWGDVGSAGGAEARRAEGFAAVDAWPGWARQAVVGVGGLFHVDCPE